MKTYTIAEEAKFKLMTEQLRLVNSDDEVAEYIKWIIRKSLPETALTPLSEITDNDAIEVANIMRWGSMKTGSQKIKWTKDWIASANNDINVHFQGMGHDMFLHFKVYQYLQSKGYELPKYY